MAAPRGSIFSLLPDYDSPLGDWEAAGRVQAAQKGLSIKYLNCSTDQDHYHLHFEITAQNLESAIAMVFVVVAELFDDEVVVPSKRVDIQPNGRANVKLTFNKALVLSKSIFEGVFEYVATVVCDHLASSTDEFNIMCLPKQKEEEAPCKMKNPEPFEESPLSLTAKQAAQFLAICMGETNNGDKELWDIAWVYFNLTKHLGFEKGMRRSAFYKNRTSLDTYKLFMFSLGQGAEYAEDKMDNGTTISAWVETGNYKDGIGKKLTLYKAWVEAYVLIQDPINPFPNWYGQGYWRDLNLPRTKDNGKWYQARVYFKLQEICDVESKYVHQMEDGRSTSYIFDEDSIASFFKKNPSKLPDNESTVPKFNRNTN